MPLELESLEAVPEALRTEFVANESGKYVPRESVALLAKRNELLEEAKKAKTEARNLAAMYEGIDPEKARKAMADAEEAEVRQLEKEKNWQALAQKDIKKATEPLIAENQTLKGDRDRYKTLYEEVLIENEINSVLPQEVKEFLAPFLQKHMAIVEENGRPVVRVIDRATGEVRMGSAVGGKPMTTKEFFMELSANNDFARFLPATGKGGSGAPSSSRGGNGVATLTLEQAKDPRLYQQAKAEAQKYGRPFPTIVGG